MNKRAWELLRGAALKVLGDGCAHCGRRSEHPQVDHILPRSQYPELELDPHNVQVLCADCNRLKGVDEYCGLCVKPNDIQRDLIRRYFIDSLVTHFEAREIALKLIEQAQRQQRSHHAKTN